MHKRGKNFFKIAFTSLFLLLISSGLSLASSIDDCPDKLFETKTVEGTYLGNKCGGDFCYSDVELDNKEKISLMCDEDDAEKFFGKGKGQRVSVTYEVRQFWNEPAADCERELFCKTGKVLDKKK